MRRSFMSVAAALGCLLSAGLAQAHVGVTASGPYANANVEASFNVGHGCENKYDTYSIKIRIPSGLTGLRMVENGSFASVTAERNAAGDVTTVTYTKAQSAVRAADDAYYKLILRFRLPNTPFATLYFPTTQVCKSQDGATTSTTEWVSTSAEHSADAGEADEPAPALTVLPARAPGWNKYTAGSTKLEVAALFKDALIVWSGDAAYSANPNTVAQIAAEDGVEALETIEPGTEFWVKY
jgi:periplasmic copper chaperone A